MADKQPQPNDVEDERNSAAKSAEDRKAASALANLDTSAAPSPARSEAVDHEAVTKAMKNLGGLGAGAGTRKNIKVDAADVALLVDQLEMTKPKATEFLKSHDGDAVKAMKAYVSA